MREPPTLEVSGGQELKTQKEPSPYRYLKLAILFLLVLPILLLARPAWHILSAHYKDVADRETIPNGFVDDASAMNLTSVTEVWDVPGDRSEAEQQLQELFQRAKLNDLKISIAGAKHSMGGHAIAPDGIVINMLPFNNMIYDEETEILNVQSGTMWHDVIEYLDGFERSVAIMQSNDSFSVGGSVSVNCHGWQFGHPPIASTVHSLRLMLADGTIAECSRSDNEELFQLVLGGYGLFGVILEVNLQTVPNRRYRTERFVVPAIEALATFDREVSNREDVDMVYARMDISRENFLNEALIYVLVHDPSEDGSLPQLKEKGLAGLRRDIFRGSVGSEYGKRLRWDAETGVQQRKLHQLMFPAINFSAKGWKRSQIALSTPRTSYTNTSFPERVLLALLSTCRRSFPDSILIY